jgi:hypothetical protein
MTSRNANDRPMTCTEAEATELESAFTLTRIQNNDIVHCAAMDIPKH